MESADATVFKERIYPVQDNFEHAGEIAIAAVIGVIAWIMKMATGRHIEAMDKIADKLEIVAGDVREMKSDIRTLRERADHTDDRLTQLEHPKL
jgi:hypothetical protein